MPARKKAVPGKGVRSRDRDRSPGTYNRNLAGSKKRFLINLGENQNLNKGALVRLVCSETGIDSAHVGRIDLHPRYAFFEVDDKAAKKVLPKIEHGTYEGKTFNVTQSADGESAPQRGKEKKRYSKK